MLNGLVVTNHPVIAASLPEGSLSSLLPPDLGRREGFEASDLIQNSFGQYSSRSAIDVTHLIRLQAQEEVQMVGDETECVQPPMVLLFSPEQ